MTDPPLQYRDGSLGNVGCAANPIDVTEMAAKRMTIRRASQCGKDRTIRLFPNTSSKAGIKRFTA
jgi:hypothetical protein